MNIYFLPSQVERELLKTLWQHSLAQIAGILVDILFVIVLFIYFIYFIYLFYLFILFIYLFILFIYLFYLFYLFILFIYFHYLFYLLFYLFIIYFNQLWLWTILWRPITRKIRVAHKNVIEKLLEIKRSIRKGMYLFQIRTVFFSIITAKFPEIGGGKILIKKVHGNYRKKKQYESGKDTYLSL